MMTAALSAGYAYAETRAEHAKLDNGMDVVVITDRRAPVVTHMVWYRVGAADEAPGKSGIAHFLEHLMFKGTDKIASGEFSKIVARNGGQDNAFTGHDVTAYFQRVAKDRLDLVMQMEAGRMTGLRLTETDVATERDVILEERRSRVDNDPSSILNEQMSAALYLAHPYGIPVIGWEHEMAKLSYDDAISFYKQYYAPNNAILVVAGDVDLDEVMKIARETYGKIPSNESVALRNRPAEPPHMAERRVILNDPRAGQATFERDYLAPSYSTAAKGEAEALEVLLRAVAGSSTSRLYRSLVVDQKIAASVGGYYSGSGLNGGKISLYGIAAPGISLQVLEDAIDAVLADVVENGLSEAEFERARKGLIAEDIYGNDSQSSLARRYGWALTTGQSIADVEGWAERMRATTLEEVAAAARTHFDRRRSVTGWLLPEAPKQRTEAPANTGGSAG